MDLKKKANELRKDILQEVYLSKAGHIGGDLSVIEILTVLYYKIMNVSPENFNSPDRDRFLLSKGHCVDALYAVLGDKGFFNKEEAIRSFSAYNSKFIGHPTKDVNGIEINSGSLGHGMGIGVGMALAGKMDKKSYKVYVVVGDGEMAEGSNYEAMMAASHYHLDNLCVTVDLNGLQISGRTKDVMSSSELSDKFRAFGWKVIEVMDGNDTEELINAYEMASAIDGHPVAVIAHTIKGKGVSFMEDKKEWHHGVMSSKEYQQAISELERMGA